MTDNVPCPGESLCGRRRFAQMARVEEASNRDSDRVELCCSRVWYRTSRLVGFGSIVPDLRGKRKTALPQPGSNKIGSSWQMPGTRSQARRE
jgi:hypothetical protein